MKYLLAIAAVFLAIACSKPMPKPYGYYRIDLPPHEYTVFDSVFPPCSFDISRYAQVQPKHAKNTQEEWIDIVYPSFNGKIHCSYIKLNSDFRQVSEDSRNLVYKHTVRADDIVEQFYENPDERVYGIFYRITGNAASPAQFVLTDSVHHFLRGALYFNAVPNADSIAPVAAYVEQDLRHLIETIKWKK
ncbi:MAG: gliding motility lipoprotein GldD [Prevotellaceae bacterium]|jgi:gliding motility-associated lipoprotein GldD|nr:gliding motility lipoprotein GldD [Prevotellaceae bacterium]